MIVIASTNGGVGIQAAIAVLRAGSSAVDAVEAGIRLVEDNPDDHSVGFGGYPNLCGEVELDASIMDGHTLAGGAVGALREHPHPISVARQVMERLPHVMLVGAGADRFADELDHERRTLLTEEARRVWQNGLDAALPPDVAASLAGRDDLWRWVAITTDPERPRGTVNFIARDAHGHICAGASTSGWAWKYPGRLGDTPIIGAGVYADDRYGAAACTGMGEMAIRACTAHSVIMYMKLGHTLAQAGCRAMADLADLGGRYLSRMNVIALDASGRHIGFANRDGQSYIYQTADMDEPAHAERVHVPITQRWDGSGG